MPNPRQVKKCSVDICPPPAYGRRALNIGCGSGATGRVPPQARPREDAGAVLRRGAGSGRPIFVIQRHDARRLHYDFRLEEDGALASWAVPKGVPLEPGDRALAVHVEDHPLDYATFEGEIPAGQYGAGTVEVWDTGTYELVEREAERPAHVRPARQRLRGSWSLVPAHLDGKEQNWLLIRRSDGAAAEEARGVQPDARDRGRAAPARRRVALRGEVRRLPRARLHPGRRLPARLAQRKRSDRAFREGGAGGRQGDRSAERRPRR